jgi:hypothetical protein
MKIKQYIPKGAKKIYKKIYNKAYIESSRVIFKKNNFEDIISKKTLSKEQRSYTKQTPSPHYHELLKQYRQMHSSEERYPGNTLKRYVGAIKRVINTHKIETIIDYGSGKGMLYENHDSFTEPLFNEKIVNIKKYWGVKKITPFEPALKDELLDKKYNLVISTDVLEHCFVADIPWIVRQLFDLSDRAVFVTVSCRFASAKLPNGEQAHSTMRAPWWWQGIFDTISNDYPDIDYFLCCESPDTNNKKSHYWFRRGFFEKNKENIRSFFTE